MTPEFSREIRLDALIATPRMALEASDAECAALAERFELEKLSNFTANVTIIGAADGAVVQGKLAARVVQTCVATGKPVPEQVNAPVFVKFVPVIEADPDAEIELADDDCDVMEHDGQAIDVGEAVAQTLALSLNPWPRHADADGVLAQAGVVDPTDVGPFAALKALKNKL